MLMRMVIRANVSPAAAVARAADTTTGALCCSIVVMARFAVIGDDGA
jgi:hypothetical protein